MEKRDQFSQFDADAAMGPIAPAREENTQREAPRDQTVPKERFDEMRAQRDELYAKREEMIQSMLGGTKGAETQESSPEPAAEDIKVVIPEGTDPEVAQLLTPIIEANNKAVYERLSNSVKASVDTRINPVEQRIGYADMVENVRGAVEGFDTVRGDVLNMLEEMDPVTREKYSNEVGLESLAYRALRDREGRLKSREDMAHSAPFGSSDVRPARSEATEADVWGMSDEEFERALANKGLSL